MFTRRGVYRSFHASSSAGGPGQRPREGEGQCRASHERQATEDQEPPGREPAGEKDDGAAEGEGNEHVAVPEEVGVQEAQDQQHRHPTHVHTPRRQGAVAGATRQHDDAGAKQHGKDGDELPVRQHGRGEPHPPVDASEVTVGGRVPACQAGEREELDVGGEHAEHAYPPEYVEGPDPRRPRCRRTARRFGVRRSRGGVCGKQLVIHAVTHFLMILNPCNCNIPSMCCRPILGPPPQTWVCSSP